MTDSTEHKFGTIKGVLIPNITMMFGVILFLRLGVLTASSGSWQMLLVIGLSLIIMICTSFSIGSLATNMKMGTGGVYYIISRTLGVEIGGAVGLAIYFAQLISIALTVAGFSLSVCTLFPHLSLHWVELATLTALTLLSGASASWSLRLQGVILALLLAAIGSVLLGSAENLSAPEDVTPFFPRGKLSFWQTFAMFYPAMTGIEAGMALSGSLRTPGQSLYKGNLYSLLIVAFCYSTICLFSAHQIPHEILVSDPFAFIDFALWPNLVIAGIWGATLSSALGCLLGAPRMLQSMAEDKIVPEAFRKVYGRYDDPRYAVLMTYILAAVVLFLTTIDQIIPMLAMICLICYGLLNFVAALTELMNTPSWRPRLRTHWLISLLGLLLTVIAMFMMAPGWALLTFLTLLAAHFTLQRRNLETSYQDLRDSLIFFISRLTLYHLEAPTQHALTWHPQILALVTAPQQQANLTRLAHSLTRRSGILSYITVLPEEWQGLDRLEGTRESIKNYFDKQRLSGLVEVYPAATPFQGYSELVKAYGIGPIQPNTVLLEIDPTVVDRELIDFIEICNFSQKNLMLIWNAKDLKQKLLKKQRLPLKRRIDICWDPEKSPNFDLMMSFVTTLTDGLRFRNAKVIVRAEVSDDDARGHVTEYLIDHCKKNRLHADVSVTLEGETGPKLGQLGFVSLKPIEANASDQQKEEYISYLSSLCQECASWDVVLFVSCYDNVDHRAIYSQ